VTRTVSEMVRSCCDLDFRDLDGGHVASLARYVFTPALGCVSVPMSPVQDRS
jgi:hypothetical protein